MTLTQWEFRCRCWKLALKESVVTVLSVHRNGQCPGIQSRDVVHARIESSNVPDSSRSTRKDFSNIPKRIYNKRSKNQGRTSRSRKIIIQCYKLGESLLWRS
jgi:hypothetical protein